MASMLLAQLACSFQHSYRLLVPGVNETAEYNSECRGCAFFLQLRREPRQLPG
ncbi:LOW QUALITY PROTEIN: ABAT isoform 4 [Pongo abelii]|uniref:ABAT isoform 4 n=1 Tax=Pongo abelii TaxID=9601 RepID=A0A2J8S0D0_PONAB|nr:LOW QUALITY PROTEIN: ABAT isoform 4 [Pongo abelii]